MNSHRLLRSTGIAVAAAGAVLALPSVAWASAPSTVYVSAHNYSGGAACLSTTVHTIQGGVNRVATGGTVIVCPGTYKESVSITKRLTLQGQGGPVVDATGKGYGIGAGADHVTVTGMTVRNAGVNAPSAGPGDGIVSAAIVGGVPQGGNYLTIKNNVLTGNMGAGIDLISTRGGLIQNNRSNGNGIGINVVDDFGAPVQNNQIIGNTASNNLVGCGIALASHTGAGVIGNVVKNNTANGNGLPAGGAGILLASPGPAPLQNNQFVGNTANGNGHSGFELHIHSPGSTVSGNVVNGNTFGTNNSGGDFSDPETTGIYLGSASPMTITVTNNHIHDDVEGIFKAGPITVIRSGNTFTNVDHPFTSIPTYAG